MFVNARSFVVTVGIIPGWFHLVVVYLGPNNVQGLVVYVNGTKEVTDTIMYRVANHPGNGKLIIGRRYTDWDHNYTSVAVDELTLWNRALSAQEIENLYQMFP